MKVYICTDHDTYWPVGGASIVVAEDYLRARELLDARLKEDGLKGFDEEPFTLWEVNLDKEGAEILCNGDY